MPRSALQATESWVSLTRVFFQEMEFLDVDAERASFDAATGRYTALQSGLLCAIDFVDRKCPFYVEITILTGNVSPGFILIHPTGRRPLTHAEVPTGGAIFIKSEKSGEKSDEKGFVVGLGLDGLGNMFSTFQDTVRVIDSGIKHFQFRRKDLVLPGFSVSDDAVFSLNFGNAPFVSNPQNWGIPSFSISAKSESLLKRLPKDVLHNVIIPFAISESDLNNALKIRKVCQLFRNSVDSANEIWRKCK